MFSDDEVKNNRWNYSCFVAPVVKQMYKSYIVALQETCSHRFEKGAKHVYAMIFIVEYINETSSKPVMLNAVDRVQLACPCRPL